MAQALKHMYSPAWVAHLGQRLAFALGTRSRGFEAGRFTAAVLGRGWRGLELKARMRRVATVMAEQVPGRYRGQLAVLSRIAPEFEGFCAMVFPDFVEIRGLDDFDASVVALARFTRYSSSEYAVRPFIVRYGDRMMRTMQVWSHDGNAHVRRLASEGCRPRLPWGIALPELKRDPKPILPILATLRGDPSEYVRRSVANNLNDIAKDHPDLVLGLARDWLGECPLEARTTTDRLLKHGLRTLLKRGDQRALRLFGHHDAVPVAVSRLRLATPRVAIGTRLTFAFELTSSAPAQVRVEYAIDFVRRDGGSKRTVFKIAERAVTPDRALVFERSHRFTDFTTRTHHPGRHRIAILVNGVERAARAFQVDAPTPKAP